jgi:hypothetical protein
MDAVATLKGTEHSPEFIIADRQNANIYDRGGDRTRREF